MCWETLRWQLRLGAEGLLLLCCHHIAAASWGGPACCSTGEMGCLLTRLGPGYLLKQPGGASAFLAAGHRGDVHPAATCLVRELLCLPQAGAGTGVSGGSAALGFCLLKRRKYKDTYPQGFIPIKILVLGNHTCSVDVHSKECCSSQKPCLWWILLLPS